MIGLDTNTVLRWVIDATGIEPADSVQSRQINEAISQSDDSVFINNVVLAEVNWVLAKRAGLDRKGRAALVQRLLDHPRVVFEQRSSVEQALIAFELGGAGFVDHLIGALNTAAGCQTTLTFDKSAAKGPHFTQLS